MGIHSSLCDVLYGHACREQTYSPPKWSGKGVWAGLQTIPAKAEDFTGAGERCGTVRPHHSQPHRTRFGKSEIGNHRTNLQRDSNPSIRSHERYGAIAVLSLIYP